MWCSVAHQTNIHKFLKRPQHFYVFQAINYEPHRLVSFTWCFVIDTKADWLFMRLFVFKFSIVLLFIIITRFASFLLQNEKKTYTHFGPLHFSLVTSNSFLPNLNGLNNLKSFGFIFKNKHSKINSNHPICHLKIKLDSSSQNVNFRKWYKSDYVLRGHKNSKVKELVKKFQMKLFWSFFELNNFVSFNLIFKTILGVF